MESDILFFFHDDIFIEKLGEHEVWRETTGFVKLPSHHVSSKTTEKLNSLEAFT